MGEAGILNPCGVQDSAIFIKYFYEPDSELNTGGSERGLVFPPRNSEQTKRLTHGKYKTKVGVGAGRSVLHVNVILQRKPACWGQ